MSDKAYIAITGTVCLTCYGIYALHTGMNGNIMTFVVSAIAGIIAGSIGFKLGSKEVFK